MVDILKKMIVTKRWYAKFATASFSYLNNKKFDGNPIKLSVFHEHIQGSCCR